EAFGYYKITVERPLRLKVVLSDENLKSFEEAIKSKKKKKEADYRLLEVLKDISKDLTDEYIYDFNKFLRLIEKKGIKINSENKKLIQKYLTEKDENAKPVIKEIYKNKEADRLYGFFEIDIDGKKVVVEYEPDTDLRNTENVPLLEEGGIEGFFEREVLPYVTDAWINKDNIKIGYEISFTKYFYKPEKLRELDEIVLDLKNLQEETEGLLDEILEM
ncbi:type I restriction-modification system specificity subunit, partial [Hydrogenivirga sp. 128-5-R1-1]